MMQFLESRILGSLANALIGDAMGSATETLTQEDILEQFGGKITTFQEPPPETFAKGNKPGQLTDDTTLMLELVDAYIASNGKLDIDTVAKHLLIWGAKEELAGRFSGPTTSKALERLREGVSPAITGIPENKYGSAGVSNGAAMKIAPAGLANPGNHEQAIHDAITICIPTHNTNLAYSGAAAVSAAIAEAITPNANLLSISDAAEFGAEQGDKIGKKQATIISGPSVIERIILAIKIASVPCGFDEACQKLASTIGCGLHIAEAVPTALGIFLASRGDPNNTVIGAINLGGDADTIGTIAGAISGAYAGIEEIDPNLYQQVIEVNAIDLEQKAKSLASIAKMTRLR